MQACDGRRVAGGDAATCSRVPGSSKRSLPSSMHIPLGWWEGITPREGITRNYCMSASILGQRHALGKRPPRACAAPSASPPRSLSPARLQQKCQQEVTHRQNCRFRQPPASRPRRSWASQLSRSTAAAATSWRARHRSCRKAPPAASSASLRICTLSCILFTCLCGTARPLQATTSRSRCYLMSSCRVLFRETSNLHTCVRRMHFRHSATSLNVFQTGMAAWEELPRNKTVQGGTGQTVQTGEHHEELSWS